MSRFNYQQISQSLLKELPSRTSDIISRRFGLTQEQKETLASIGKDYNVTRERIRQIEEQAIKKLKPEAEKHGEVFDYFVTSLKNFGNLKREDRLFLILGEEFKNHINFLLTLGSNFERRPKDKQFYPLWTIDKDSVSTAQEVINSLIDQFKKKEKPLPFAQMAEIFQKKQLNLESPVLASFVEVSREIKKGPTGEYGLKDWPEINPRGMRDRAFLVLRKEKKPLHFTKVTELINEYFPKKRRGAKIEALSQTVHNELIKDKRFVLVGRGIYALKEWGFKRGTVKDVISKILKESNKPLSKEEVISAVLNQRMVKKSTILLNLQSSDSFKRDSQGKYRLA